MIYIVSGYMRSGTSMMMEALIKGGMKAEFDKSRDEHVAKFEDDKYKANPHGLFEIEFNEYKNPDFAKKYEGKLVKVFSWALEGLPKASYKIVFMERDLEEVRQSYEAMLSSRSKSRPPMDGRVNPPVREDMEITTLQYTDVINNPFKIFSELQKQDFPIDPLLASSVVDPKLYRFRKELLIPGV
jgi:hypothetical protein